MLDYYGAELTDHGYTGNAGSPSGVRTTAEEEVRASTMDNVIARVAIAGAGCERA